jgi:heterodisulfide reductase subunit C
MESILRSRTIWICASCYACTVRCPAGIKITDLIYALKRTAMDREIRSNQLPISTLSRQFVRLVNRYGRNQELKLVMRYQLRTRPLGLFKMLPLAWRMMRSGRLPWRTHRIRGLPALRRIISKAEEMEHLYPRDVREPLGEVGYGVVAERPVASAGGGS